MSDTTLIRHFATQTPAARRPVRVLHVVGAMNRGGVETWLMNMLRTVDRHQVRMDFLVHTAQPAAYDDEIRSLGSSVLSCPFPSNWLSYARRLRRILVERGPFDVVHSHVHFFSGAVLRVAAAAGVPVRIAHSHSDTSRQDDHAGLRRRVYLRLTRALINRYATHQVACSRPAAHALFGARWTDDPRRRSIYCGVHLSSFSQRHARDAVRQELMVPHDAIVIGHVGSFQPTKNQAFLIRVAAKVINRHPNVYVLMIGDGPLRHDVLVLARELGIERNVRMPGVRPDIPGALQSMDVFLFPSIYEGLPLALIEAQAASLPCIISDTIALEVIAIPRLVKQMSLSSSLEQWAEAVEVAAFDRINRLCRAADGGNDGESRLHVFDIRNTNGEFLQLYGALKEASAPTLDGANVGY